MTEDIPSTARELVGDEAFEGALKIASEAMDQVYAQGWYDGVLAAAIIVREMRDHDPKEIAKAILLLHDHVPERKE